ncbi:flagellar basal body protein [Photobacterium toruni]|uniref:flagellar basal body protein n=1 Tax=Photobacterium toruni TaxID=1935446 RepID=UPI00211028FA|nr:flagellar basal body rod C-terminal domain-containing protein [Photobacterium toruni]
MDSSMYIAMSAAKQDLMRTAIVAQNVANANTVGFKSDHAEFQPLFAQMTNTLNSGAYTQLETMQVNTARGTYRTTGLSNDLSARNGFWIAVSLPDGTEGYITTATTMTDKNGVLRTAQGNIVLGNRGKIKIQDGNNYRFTSNGSITVRNNDTTEVIDKLKVVEMNGKALIKGPYGVLTRRDGRAMSAVVADGAILPGVLENSNVNSMVAMTESLEIAKSYQDQINMIMAAKTLDKNSNSLIKLN